MKYRLIITIICTTFVFINSIVLAQNVEVTDSCTGGWEPITVAVPDSNSVIKLSSTKEGSEKLSWLCTNGKMGKLEIHKVKGQVEANGSIDMCTSGQLILILNDEISFQDLPKNGNLQLGNYAIRVSSPDNFNMWNNSNWFLIELK